MRHVRDPRQISLFDRYIGIFSEKMVARLNKDWPGVLRHTLLELMPVDVVAGEFDPKAGRPTKELYSMCGLLLITEFMNWTAQQAADAYTFDLRVQYALNLPLGARHTLCSRTVERYKRILVEHQLAGRIMEDVTGKLVELLELDVSRQRLDSTHVLSDMAVFGRTRLMGVTVKRFLTQLKRHDRCAYDGLDAGLRARYETSDTQLFAQAPKDIPARRAVRLQVARDMRCLIEQFAGDPAVTGRTTYKHLEQVFGEQCEIAQDGKLDVKENPGNRVMQNPADSDATRNGQKGPGYKVQIAETCSADNPAQLILSAIPQTGADDDRQAMPQVLQHLEQQNVNPDELLADTHYGSDADQRLCEEHGVHLIAPAPTPGLAKDASELNLADFEVDEATDTVTYCPAGYAPESSRHDPDTDDTQAAMPAGVCADCAHLDACPVTRGRDGQYRLRYNGCRRRLQVRRRQERTDAFRRRYALRSGIESTNSGLKRRTGLGRVRVRGRPAVFHSILMKVCGWNILQAAATQKLRQHVAERAAQSVLSGLFGLIWRQASQLMHLQEPCEAFWRRLMHRRAALGILAVA